MSMGSRNTDVSTTLFDRIFDTLSLRANDDTTGDHVDDGSSPVTSRGGKILLLDGGTGEELFRQGVPDDRKLWSATAVVQSQYHSILRQVHQSFIRAGSQAITTNSYAITPHVGFSDDELYQYASEAGRLARECVVESKTETLVMGSLPPLQESYRSDLILPHTEGVRYYSILVQALAPHVDCFLAETMSCYEESIQVVDAVVGVGSPKPLLVSFTLNSNGTLRSGELAVHVIHKLLAFARERHVPIRAVLFNCSEPEAITLALQQVCNDETLRRQNEHTSGGETFCPLILGAYANRLTPVASDWTMADSDGPQLFRTDMVPKEYYDTFVSTWINEYNIQLVGGCCGITPEHIQYLNEKIHSNN